MRTNYGADYQAAALGGQLGVCDYVSFAGGAAGLTATSTSLYLGGGVSWNISRATNDAVGHILAVTCDAFTANNFSSHFGTIVANTSGTQPTFTVDRFISGYASGVASLGTPSWNTSSNLFFATILPGQQPAPWIAISTDGTAPSASDTTLASELSTNGLGRVIATYAHTAGTTTYTLSNTFTNSAAAGTNNQFIQKVAVLQSSRVGSMVFEDLISSPSNVQGGDSLTVTETISM